MPQWLAIAYLGIFGSAVIFFLLTFALGRTTPTRVAISVIVNPVTASLVGVVMLGDPTIGLRILAILAETGFSPRRLELEITETALVDNIKVAQDVTSQLRQVGVRIALDDFGEYATLSQFLSLKLDRIKIDRSFVDRLGKDKESTTIVRAVLGLASGFELETTAEGIENDEQHAALIAAGCLEGQGYLFSKAVPANEVQSLLESHKLNTRAVA
jgi:EAL domain-containing protein (putative c-di-GMP-specific phosphodiesterase class I)